MTVLDIRSRLGKAADEILPLDANPTEKHDYKEWWDSIYHIVWVDDASEPQFEEEHGLTRIPIAFCTVEGSELFMEDNQETRQPLLYGLKKSGIWKRQNLALTAEATSVTKVALYPNYVHTKNEAGDDIELNFDVPGGVIEVPSGAALTSMQKNAIDPALMAFAELMERKAEESTVYRQTLGEPMGANAPFSMVALLSQSGRLPLVYYQRMLSHVMGEAMSIGLEIIKKFGTSVKVKGAGQQQGTVTTIELAPKEIPDYVDINCKLDVQMPQDDRQNAQIVQMLTAPQDPKVSKRWALSEILKIGQPERMQEEIWTEQLTGQMVMQLMPMLAQNMLAQFMPQQAQQPGGPGMPPGMPGGAPGGAPGDIQGMPRGLAGMNGMPPGAMPLPQPSPGTPGGSQVLPGVTAPAQDGLMQIGPAGLPGGEGGFNG